MSEQPDSHSKHRELREVGLDMALSGLSAVVSKTAVAPFERVKLVLQTQASNQSIVSKESKRYTGIIDCFVRILREQGIWSFWRGNSATLLKYAPLQIMNFTLYSKLKRMFPKVDPHTDRLRFVLSNLAKGAVAGGASIIMVYPLDYVRTKMATDLGKKPEQREFRGFIDCVKKVYGKGGFANFYTAFPLSLVCVMFYRGIYFGLFDSLMQDRQKKSLWWSFLFAQVSTNTAGLVVYPFDTVRRNLVLQSAKGAEGSKYLKDGSALQCARRLYAENGIKGLYAGCLINLMRGFGSSLVLVLYDSLKTRTANAHEP
jgi:solute carrier family 25 (mitochondrial adenine nucleotide translocator), member 4/5/6/31